LGSVLAWQLAKFGAALLLIHALLGLMAFAFARLTETAFPGRVIAGRGWLVAGWFAVLVGVLMAVNTTWFSSSIFAAEESRWRSVIVGLYPIQLVIAALTVLILWLAIRAAKDLKLRPSLAPGLALAAVVAIVFWVARPGGYAASAAAADSRPHIVILGIDSLRNDLTIPRRGVADTQYIGEFLEGARRFNDAITPLPRTYGSWVSILTGRHPTRTHARVNLMPRSKVREGTTLADALSENAYRSTYATDEVRFANFDRSFGFDQLITPPVGAVDFLLGYAGDMPFVNIVASTAAGEFLFPSNHANRAACVTYEPRQFVNRLERELSIDGPSFLAIHLTLAHWPYAWAGRPIPTVPEAYRDAYGEAVAEVDRQFHDVMQLLADKRVLDNAIVVLLSDHGEALGADKDSMLRGTGTGREIWDSLWGHGTSVMSPNQYQVLLAMRAYGRARLPGPEQDYDWPVSLEDLRPTLEEIATGKAPADVDGISLLPFLEDPSRAAALATRIRFTETDFNTPDILAGRYEASGIIDEAATYYELEYESGWVQFREDRLPELLARKQRAAISSDTLLAAIPGLPGEGPRYLLTDRHMPAPRALERVPDPSTEPEARLLWDALKARFPGELPPDPELPRM
ncbi:MAG TPA: sulfatase-like hydrolase/transferase, partial [Steroidobacteraceae bacterium]